jgi:hypothetical protein
MISVVVIAGAGFGFKLLSFILEGMNREDLLIQPAVGTVACLCKPSEQTAFGPILIPVVGYLVATAGFFLLFVREWFSGGFHDVEETARLLIENERRLEGK